QCRLARPVAAEQYVHPVVEDELGIRRDIAKLLDLEPLQPEITHVPPSVGGSPGAVHSSRHVVWVRRCWENVALGSPLARAGRGAGEHGIGGSETRGARLWGATLDWDDAVFAGRALQVLVAGELQAPGDGFSGVAWIGHVIDQAPAGDFED